MHYKFLKKYYFIDKFEKSNIDKQDLNTTIIYRNYKKNYKISEILFLKNYCRSKRLKFVLSNNIKLSIKLDLDGAYLPSFNNDFSHLGFTFKKEFLLIGSAHNVKEIRIKEKQKVNKIFISSIFKENNNFLGINKFNLISKLSNNEIVALGGITKNNIKLINLTSSSGFAGISFFQ
tara:strand:+ start:445 stop:972 length:528 start_codon:yes stop_codon:yes gene_type:complete